MKFIWSLHIFINHLCQTRSCNLQKISPRYSPGLLACNILVQLLPLSSFKSFKSSSSPRLQQVIMGFIIRHSCSCFLTGCASLTSIDCRQMSEQVLLTWLEVAGWIFRQGVWWSRFSHCSWKGNILLSFLAQYLQIQWVNLITEHSYVLRSLHRHH